MFFFPLHINLKSVVSYHRTVWRCNLVNKSQVGGVEKHLFVVVIELSSLD
jgi:hypothetical protein